MNVYVPLNPESALALVAVNPHVLIAARAAAAIPNVDRSMVPPFRGTPQPLYQEYVCHTRENHSIRQTCGTPNVRSAAETARTEQCLQVPHQRRGRRHPQRLVEFEGGHPVPANQPQMHLSRTRMPRQHLFERSDLVWRALPG